MRAMMPSPILVRVFLRRLQRQPQVDRKQAALHDARQPAAVEHLRKKYFHRQHRRNRREPDHCAPGRGKPKADSGHKIDNGEKNSRRLPCN
jgi:hypothetical protein